MENLELYKRICEEFGSEDIERIDFVEVDGVKYTYKEVEELDTIDEGKYQYGGTIYGVGILKGEYNIEEILFYMRQDFSQTGSYYSEQERYYRSPYIVEKKDIIKTIWAKIK